MPRDGSLSGLALREDRTIVLGDGDERPPVAPAGAALALHVPGAGGGALGALLLSRQAGRADFTKDEQDSAAVFAGQIGVALELAQQQDQRRRLLLLEDRERIGRDLHDHVIQSLFGEGMAIVGLIARVRDPVVAERLEQHVTRLDETISAIRHTIFELQQLPGEPQLFRTLLLATVRDVTAALGRAPVVRVVGPVDTLVSEEVTAHAVAVIREALTNVARHAHATRVHVAVDVDERRLSVVVTDDGMGLAVTGGLGSSGRLSGRANLLRRAEQLAGSFTVCSPDPATGTGTRLEWTVPPGRPAPYDSATGVEQLVQSAYTENGMFTLGRVEAQERGVDQDEAPDEPELS